MFGSPSKDVSKLTNRISALEANLLRSEALSKETSEQRDKGFERVKKLEAEKAKWKKRDEVERTRLAALKAKVDHFKDERDEFEAKYISSADRLKKLESLETDRNLLDRIEKMRNLNDLDSNQTWLDVSTARNATLYRILPNMTQFGLVIRTLISGSNDAWIVLIQNVKNKKI